MRLIGITVLAVVLAVPACGGAPADDLFGAGDISGSGGANAGDGGSGGANAGDGGSGGANAGDGGSGGNGAVTGGSGGSGAGGSGAGGSEQYPPGLDQCVPRCLWDLWQPCRAETACMKQEQGRVFVMCEPETGWLYDYDERRSMRQVEVHKGGELCYYAMVHTQGEDYFEPDGTFVARVVRGPYSAWVDCSGDAPGVNYQLDLESNECSQFAAIDCEAGSCPAP